MPFLRLLRALSWSAMLFALAGGLWIAARIAHVDEETAPLDLGAPIGPRTHARLVALGEGGCTALLDAAGIAYRLLPERRATAECAIGEGVAWRGDGARAVAYAPAGAALACPLAAGLATWEWDRVQPAAWRLLGSPVVRIDHYGTYACRRTYGRATGRWSQHARGLAIDVAGFRLADGRRITVARDWRRDDARGAFLHAVRDGACDLFSTTLSPDYNAAHRDHLHIDLTPRYGGFCR